MNDRDGNQRERERLAAHVRADIERREASRQRRSARAADRSRRLALGLRDVDAAVLHYQGICAAEAVGHFLRSGAPGPPRFQAPTVRAA